MKDRRKCLRFVSLVRSSEFVFPPIPNKAEIFKFTYARRRARRLRFKSKYLDEYDTWELLQNDKNKIS